MSKKQCQSCDAKNRQQARFCASCGAPFVAAQRQAWKLYVGALLLSLFVFVGFRATMKPPPQNQDNHVHTPDDGHTHEPSHASMPEASSKRLAQLKNAAQSGAPTDLAAYAMLIKELSSQHPELLQEAVTPLKAIVAQVDDAWTWKQLGDTHFDLNQYPEAIDAYKRYLELQPGDANVLTDMGTQYFYNNQIDEAIEAYEQAVAVFPNHYHAHFNLYLLYTRTEKPQKAQEHLDRTVEIEKAFGKIMAPHRPLKPQFAEAAPASPYQQLEQFFRTHPIMGPKFDSLQVKGNQIQVMLLNFPMDIMPENAKITLSSKIKNQLEQLDSPHTLQLVDHQSGKILAEY
ncbi:MAG: tetratricopeptide repeat protein [Acidobacteria bacterium]|nr:tetratricopeptide repeat protein [Acidobacteriota bacterium]